jgi:flagellum-specific peptidoglycan hydrolase FlgJ
MPGRQPPPNVVQAAQAAAAQWKIPASVLLAQWALESAWGTKEPDGSNNPFGEKALPGEPFVAACTHEDIHNQVIAISARFKAFLSLADAFDAHAEHLATSHFYMPARAKLPDVDGFCRALTGVYATDPHYGDSVIAVINGSDLGAYDLPSPRRAPEERPTPGGAEAAQRSPKTAAG